jgi:hypothetical protein
MNAQFEAVADRSLRDAEHVLGVLRSVVHRWRLSRKRLDRRRERPRFLRVPAVAASHWLSRGQLIQGQRA